MTDKTRAEFEAWAAERAPFILDKLAQDDDGGRLAAATAWLAWQAALATKAAPEPEVEAQAQLVAWRVLEEGASHWPDLWNARHRQVRAFVAAFTAALTHPAQAEKKEM